MNLHSHNVNDAIRFMVNKSLINHQITTEEAYRMEMLRSLIASARKTR